MTKQLSIDIDRFSPRKDRVIFFLGPSWLSRHANDWKNALVEHHDYITLDLSAMSFVTLADWVYFVACLDTLIEKCSPREVSLDILGHTDLRLIDTKTFLALQRGERIRTPYTQDDLRYSEEKYKLVGFLESLDTLGVLNRPERSTHVIYPGLSRQAATLKSFYATKSQEDKPKVFLGLHRIDDKEDCKLFLDGLQILNWRRAMDVRFRQSPLFDSDEVWRVLCHELALNIWEHSGAAGFVAARVVGQPLDSQRRMRPWCRWTYEPELHGLMREMETGFLELCVADAGDGIGRTLRDAMASRSGADVGSLSTADVLCFAFDELGTCKDDNEVWVTARHGLSRVLSLVAKYGGALRIRSGDTELMYIANENRFARRKYNLGYEPQIKKAHPFEGPGSQIQLILPLLPIFKQKRALGRPRLDQILPESFRTQERQFRGYMVLLLEELDTPEPCVDSEELRVFQSRCERLGRYLVSKRPRNEALVFDFSGLNWTAKQFELFFYLLQNVLQNRPVLIVELADGLAREILEAERTGLPTNLDSTIIPKTKGAADKAFDEVAEQKFLETYSLVHSTVLVTTRERAIHIFGVPSADYERALLSLLEVPSRIEDLRRGYPGIEESTLRGILNPINPLFEASDGEWSLVWSLEMINTQMERAIVSHFDSVAVRSMAWRGRIECKDKGIERFYLPWSNVWRREFLQTSRILNRGRQVDEVAQRLLFKLRNKLESEGKSLNDVKVLVVVSAPAMLLATALHRWWPNDARPAVADIGHYVFLGDAGGLPAITTEGGIAIVQDVLDDGKITSWVIDRLERQHRKVLIVIAFVRFLHPGQAEIETLPTEVLIDTSRPLDCDPPRPDDDDSYDYWVEPRSLRPVRFRTLRREFDRRRDPDLERRNEYLEHFDGGPDGCLIMSGHYVYGIRHFAVTVDIRRALDGEIGDEIARWIADICEGNDREGVSWEREEGRMLMGDVTAVLMPLQSQIHYLWPKVEGILAQRGRRQPMWLLEPAIFTGAGPGYRLPLQFRHQLVGAVRDSLDTDRNTNPLRILVLDDAFASGRTATDVLATIIREIEKAMRGVPRGVAQSPVEWIRYFTLLNQSDHATHLFWRHVAALSRYAVQVVLEEYAPFMGVTVYNESDCPVCRDRARLLQLLKASEDYGGQGARGWIIDRVQELMPVAVDGAEFKGGDHPRLIRRLDVLAPRAKGLSERRYKAWFVDTAIWRLYELMSLSYPPSEVLLSLDEAWPKSHAEGHLRHEYERYRWAVYEWCIRHWRRVVADSAGALFVRRAFEEIKQGTNLVERILEAVATRYDDELIRGLILMAVGKLSLLERGRRSARAAADSDRIERAIQLDTALQLFFFNVKRFDRERASERGDEATMEYRLLLDGLDSAAAELDSRGHSLLRNLHRRLLRSSRFADPRWGLEVLAESLFRGRDAQRQPAGSHKLLPRLLSNVLKGSPDEEDLRLLHGSLVLFLAGLQDLLPYADMDFSLELTEVKEQSEEVLRWLRLGAEGRSKTPVASVRYLFQSLDLENGFCQHFGDVFHAEIESVIGEVRREAARKGAGRLSFEYSVSSRAQGLRVLTHVQRLVLTLMNRAVDPIEKHQGHYASKIEVDVDNRVGSEVGFICFRIFTNFAPAAEVVRLLADSRNTSAEESLLSAFGVEFGPWEVPNEPAFAAENKMYVPSGFKPAPLGGQK